VTVLWSFIYLFEHVTAADMSQPPDLRPDRSGTSVIGMSRFGSQNPKIEKPTEAIKNEWRQKVKVRE
jgi:hypothetical protein